MRLIKFFHAPGLVMDAFSCALLTLHHANASLHAFNLSLLSLRIRLRMFASSPSPKDGRRSPRTAFFFLWSILFLHWSVYLCESSEACPPPESLPCPWEGVFAAIVFIGAIARAAPLSIGGFFTR